MSKSELWTVSELAGEFDLTTQALRFYEEKGLLSPRRVGNTRVYDRRDRARLTLVRKFQRLGFSLEDIREYLSLLPLRPPERRSVSRRASEDPPPAGRTASHEARPRRGGHRASGHGTGRARADRQTGR